MLKETDILSRFIHYSSDINWDIIKVKSSLFSKKHLNGFSVFETTNLDKQSIEKIELYVRNERSDKKPAYGRCDMAVKYYKEGKLEIKEQMPPQRHYNIWGMPVSNDLTDANNLSIRQKMANEYSELILYRSRD